METIKIIGTCQGFQVQYERTFPNPEEEFPELADIIGFLMEKGMEKPVVKATPTPAAAAPAAKPSGSASWVCSVHGSTKVGPGYQGRGKQCNVTVFDEEPDWPSRSWTRRDGGTAYSCSEKSH